MQECRVANTPFQADQAWRSQSGDSWVKLEERTDAQLDPFGLAAMERLAPKPGERVLDVGCGTGQTLLELADAVGPRGHVLGVDISEQMLGRAKERVAARGASHVDLVLGDAQTHAFGERFDAAFSRFGIMFFRDSEAALRNLLGALEPGGRLAFVCWQSMSRNPWARLLLDAVMPVLGATELPPLVRDDQPGPFFFHDVNRVRRHLERAGFESISVEPLERQVHFGAAMTLQEGVEFSTKIGPAARAMADSDPALRPRLLEALEGALAPFMTERGLWLDGAAWIFTARRPRSSF